MLKNYFSDKTSIKHYKKAILIYWTCFFAVILLLTALFIGVSKGMFGFMPDFKELENPKSSLATEIISSDGKLLGKYYFQNRTYVKHNELSPYLETALVSTEDARYYSHSGIDAIGLVRVGMGVITGNRSAGGGSTLSQQLAKMLFPRKKFDNIFSIIFRKLREWVIAVKLEKNYTKEEIIAMYLNRFDFLNLAVGIKSASNIYFNTQPDSLRIEQAAMLVGMAKNPSFYNPVRRAEETKIRRNVVLNQMVKFGNLDKTECDSLKKLDLGLDFHRADHRSGPAPYFREYLREFLSAKKPVLKGDSENAKIRYKRALNEWNNNPFYGWCNKNKKVNGDYYNLYKDGIKIYTTIDSRMQKYAELAVAEHLGMDLQMKFDDEKKHKKHPPYSNDVSEEQVERMVKNSIRWSERYRVLKKVKRLDNDSIMKIFNTPTKMKVFSWKGEIDTLMTPHDSILYYKSFFRAAMMSMNPLTGEVKAYVGGPNFKHFSYDMVSKGRRQVGSTIKPIVYTLAMQEGLTPCDKVPNIPQTFIMPDGKPWTSRNSTKARSGEIVSLKWGLAHSVNNISGWVLKQTNPESVVKMAHKMGITSKIDAVPSIFLGTSEISVKEMVGAYSSFVNKGVYIKPRLISKIEDSKGNLISKSIAQKNEAMDEKTAYLITNLLKGVVERGTGMRLWIKYGLKNPIGGKTGTTQNHSDGWFMGITPELVSGVWVGAEDRAIHFRGIKYGQGANMALPIWALYMQKVYEDKSLNIYQGDFPEPAGFDINLDCDDDKKAKKDEEENNSEEIEDDSLFY
ncbi:MAG: transglycosylase domain-containing protein [Marinifilaceae bacterium]|jgi:penicillin-binding protein 1A|nr:transglycosylase domain-containing protein [Marinifilaceae bacterium]